MRVRRLILGPLETNCWLVDDGAGGAVAVIDPADDAGSILQELGDARVGGIVLTHGHFDHLAAVRALVRATAAPLAVHRSDADAIRTAEGTGGRLFGFDAWAPKADRVLDDGDEVMIGSVRFEVIHTPGHTPGSVCLLAGNHLFSGDTLFAGSVGRTDFPGGDVRAMQRSIARLSALPDEVLVHPGHGPDTTIGRERRVNPFFPRA